PHAATPTTNSCTPLARISSKTEPTSTACSSPTKEKANVGRQKVSPPASSSRSPKEPPSDQAAVHHLPGVRHDQLQPQRRPRRLLRQLQRLHQPPHRRTTPPRLPLPLLPTRTQNRSHQPPPRTPTTRLAAPPAYRPQHHRARPHPGRGLRRRGRPRRLRRRLPTRPLRRLRNRNVKQYRQLTRHASDGTTTDDDRYDPAHATEDALLTPEEPTDWPWPVLFPTPHKGTPPPPPPRKTPPPGPQKHPPRTATPDTPAALPPPQAPAHRPWPVPCPTPHKGTPTPTTPEELAAADPEEVSVELTPRETSDALQAARAFRDTIETAKNTFDEAQAAFTA